MNSSISERNFRDDKFWAESPIIPIVQSDEPTQAVQIARALEAAGFTSLEVVLRTPNALHCLEAIAHGVPLLKVGAGTVVSRKLAQQARDSGVDFLVSPGLDESIVEFALALQIPYLPGVATATEVQAAHRLGLRTVKFFPASLVGGIDGIKALSGVFPRMRFVPTGGLNENNFLDYLALPTVVACGGSWIVDMRRASAGDFASIEENARRTIQLVER